MRMPKKECFFCFFFYFLFELLSDLSRRHPSLPPSHTDPIQFPTFIFFSPQESAAHCRAETISYFYLNRNITSIF